ncbi:MAG: hypothetical protein Q9180_008447, partial [Flavoplaca navasiana]
RNVNFNGLGRIPSVSLYGLDEEVAQPTSSKGTGYLACGIRESHPFLQNFRTFVDTAFYSNGLMPIPLRGDKSPYVRILNLNYCRTEIAKEKITLRGKGYVLSPKFDASDLYQKYKDFAWTTEFPLEMLCISELGLKDFWKDGKVVRTSYRDIACVPLPGVSEHTVAEIAAQQSTEDYAKAEKSYKQNQP